MQSSSMSHPWLPSTRPQSAQDALITASIAPLLELRQNNPQDCANLIAASVDRATVEISRTIIALNATFSQQLQQASMSASNGIKSAESSASSSISIVSQNASSATSSASFSLNLANLAVTSVNSALTDANIALASAQSQAVGANLVLTSALSASTSEVLRLSSSLSSLEATLVSVKASASAAIDLAVMSQQPSMGPQGTAAISLAPVQLAGIVVGTMVASVVLGFTVGFVLIRVRSKGQRKASMKETTRSQKMPLSRSSAFSSSMVVVKFSPQTSIYDDAPAPERTPSLSTTHEPEEAPIASLLNTRSNTKKPSTPRSNEWPLKSSLDSHLDDGTADLYGPKITTSIPHGVSAQTTDLISHTYYARQLVSEDFQDKESTINHASPPHKAGIIISVEEAIIAGAHPDPAKPVLTFESTHCIARDSGRKFGDLGTLHGSGEEPWTIRQYSSMCPCCGIGTTELNQHVPGAEAFENPFADHGVGLQEIIVEDSVCPPFGRPEQASWETLMDNDSYQDPIDQENIVWKEANEASPGRIAQGSSARTADDPTPESMPSSSVVAETLHFTTKSGITIKRDSSRFKESTKSERVQDKRPPVSRDTNAQLRTRPESRNRISSPLRQNTLIGFSESGVETPSPATEEERELSPLRRNPPFEAISSRMTEQQGGAIKLAEESADEHESRGRSMIRTSDILGSRLLGLAQTNKSHHQTLQQRGGQAGPSEVRLMSPVPNQQNSGISGYIQADQTSLKQHLAARKRVSSTTDPPSLTSKSFSHSVSFNSTGVTAQRDESPPLCRNVSSRGLDPRLASDARPIAGGNAEEFSRAFSKFQTLASQNARDAFLASNEVTSRAIAGIYIPGSLREQAVRNLSKSRERGTVERQRK